MLYATRTASWFTPRFVIAAALFTAALVVAAWVPSAHAATRGPSRAVSPTLTGERPDLKITVATFDGRNLHVEYVNATGVYDRRRYEVGFQWYDAAGQSIGVRHWLPQPEVERGGVAILDTKYRTELSYKRRDGVYGRRLSAFVAERPDTAVELRVTVDDGDRIGETDETNNIAALKFSLPDLQITAAGFTDASRVELKYRNANPAVIAQSFRIGFTWVDDAGAVQAATRWVYALEPESGAEATLQTMRTDASYISESGGQAGDRLDWYLGRRPAKAAQLKITLDDAGTVTESNEQNNAVLLRVAMPDLTIRDAVLFGDTLTLTSANASDAGTGSFMIGFQWVTPDGIPVGREYAALTGALGPKEERPFSSKGVTVFSGSGNRQAYQYLSTFLHNQPSGAELLRITIDSERALAESNEGNNIATVVSKQPDPDLTIRDASFTAGRLRFIAVNTSAGPARAPVSFWFEWVNADGERELGPFWYDEPRDIAAKQSVLIDSANLRVWGVPARGDRVVESPFAAILAAPVPGVTGLKVWVDGPNRIAESNEANNTVLLSVPLPDLTVIALTLTDDAITWKVKNLGDTAEGGISYRTTLAWLAADGRVLAEQTMQTAIEQLFGGQALLEDIPADFRNPPAGAVKFRVVVDAKGDVVEKDEGNNSALLEQLPQPKPDLTVSNLALADKAITWKQENIGREASGRFSFVTRVEWLDAKGTTLGSQDPETFVVTVMERGVVGPQDTKVEYGIPEEFFIPPLGAVTLRVVTDAKHTIGESDEGNNIVTITIPAHRPDLAVTNLAHTGDAITWKQENIGDAVSGKFSFVTLVEWLDTNGTTLARQEPETFTPKLLPKGVVGAQDTRVAYGIPASFFAPPRGAVKLRVTVDPKNTVAEKDEGNNAVEIAIPESALKRPDLTFSRVFIPEGRSWLAVEYKNLESAVGSPEFSWAMYWVDASGKRLGTPYEGTRPALKAWGSSGASSDTDVPLGKWLAQPKPAGATQLEIVIDPENRIAESDETNNRTTFDGWSPPKRETPKLPDLTITKATFDTAALRFQYHNRGDGEARPGVSFWYEWVDAAGRRVSELRWINIGGMGPRTTSEGNQLLDFADLDGERGKIFLGEFVANAPESATHLKLTIDGPNAHAEANEQNNSVLLPNLVLLRPDLILRDAALSREKLKVTIVNVGKGTAERVMWQFVWRGKNSEALATSEIEAAVGTLKPGASYPVELPIANARAFGIFRFLRDMPNGSVALEIAVDPKGAIAESDERNNTARVVLPSQSDLVVSDVEVRDGALHLGARNVGTADAKATDAWLMWFGVKGALPSSGAVDLPAIAAGKETTVVVPLDGSQKASRILRDPPTDGTRLRIFLDGSRKVDEANEQNNDAWLDRAKLATTANQLPVADAGEDITERDDDGDGKEMTRFYSRNSKDPDGKIVKWAWTVAGREVATGQFPYWRDVPVGTHEVTLTVTDNGGLTATDTVRVTVQPKPATQPDLALDAFTMTPTQPKPGDTVTFTVRVVNRSTISVGTVSSVSFDIWTDSKYRTQLAQPVVRDLAPGESQEFHWNDPKDRSYHWKPQAGSHRISVCVDNMKLITESNEQNNCSAVNVVVRAPEPVAPKQADLVVERISVTPAKPVVGDAALTFTAVVRNIGGAASDASVAYLSLDLGDDDDLEGAPEPEDVPAIAAGTTKTVTWQGEAAVAGTHRIEVCADVAEDVEEANEENNCREQTFTVGGAASATPARTVASPFRSILGAILSGLATPIVAGGGP